VFEQFDEWRGKSVSAMERYVDVCRRIEILQAEQARLLAETISAYEWPADVPEPSRLDDFGTQHIGQHAYGEDLTGELALANKTSMTSAWALVREVTDLIDHLPGCWSKVSTGEAALWQARHVARLCTKLPDQCMWQQVDEAIAPALGQVGPGRLFQALEAELAQADPEGLRLRTQPKTRFVHTGGDELDPASGWLSARLDRKDAISLENIVQLVADALADNGDAGSIDERRSRALGVLANPAAAIQLVTVPAKGTNPERLRAAFTPRTQVYVHLYADNLADREAIARVEMIGPLLTEQVASITQGSRVRLTPVLHVGADSIGVDEYEIPDSIRRLVLLRDQYDVFPWSSVPSRHLDLDHSIPYRSGPPGQTRPDNLGPLSRRAHRLKTHASWRLDQIRAGTFAWRSPAGQAVQVDYSGSHYTQ